MLKECYYHAFDSQIIWFYFWVAWESERTKIKISCLQRGLERSSISWNPLVYLLQVTLTYITNSQYERSVIISCINACILAVLSINKRAKAGSAPIASVTLSVDSFFRFVQSKWTCISIQNCCGLFNIMLKTHSTVKHTNPDLVRLSSYQVKCLSISQISQLWFDKLHSYQSWSVKANYTII